MQLNHLNIVAADVAALGTFFTRCFGFTLLEMRGRDAFAVLQGSDGFSLNIMPPGRGETAEYPKNFHLGFFVESPEAVRAKWNGLADAGYAPGAVQELHRGGKDIVTFYCTAPGDVLVEVSSFGS